MLNSNACLQKVSNVPDEKCSLIKTKDRFPNYDCVVGSILHAMNCEQASIQARVHVLTSKTQMIPEYQKNCMIS